ncbi:MAG: AIR carboxylase family protein, partial [Fibrobacter sp.]|nr:AIR carboxylase family protein [Fibrobacter sp.]
MFNYTENAKVGIVAGSKSDQEVVDKITAVLDSFGIKWELNILSAHRTPNATAKYAKEAADRGLQVIIGVAGLAAALPGVLAA